MIPLLTGFDEAQQDYVEAAFNRLLIKLGLSDLKDSDLLEDPLMRLHVLSVLMMDKISVALHAEPIWHQAMEFNMKEIQSVLDVMVTMLGHISPTERAVGITISAINGKPVKRKRMTDNYFVHTVESYLCSLFLTVYRYHWPFVSLLNPEEVSLLLLVEEGKKYIRRIELKRTQM